MRRIVITLPVATVASLLVPLTIGAQLVQPIGITLAPSQQEQFSLNMNGASLPASWKTNPRGVGTVTSDGLYTAPSVITAATTINLVAINSGVHYSTQVHLAPNSVSPSGSSSTSGSVSPAPPTSNVSVTLSPTSVYLTSGQRKRFTVTVSGSSNASVNWTLTPNVGTMNQGVYTAPSGITADSTVTVKAISATDPTVWVTAVVNLGPSSTPSATPTSSPAVYVSLSPPIVNLSAGGTAQLTATVGGTTNTAVTWTLSPNTGTVTNGLYTAPSTISKAADVFVTATSVADPTKSSYTTIVLAASTSAPSTPSKPVSITMAPTSISLQGGGKQQFTPTVSGSTNTAVSWSLTPNVGTISNGLYTAPATVTNAQTVSVVATSSADSTKTASASVQLQPPAPSNVYVSLSPPIVNLSAGGSAQLTATVGGTTNTAVSWTLSPNTGTVTNGLYTAPSTISKAADVFVTATSVADPTKSSYTTIVLAASTSTPSTPSTPVSITMTPTSISLQGGGTQQFTPTVSGTTNTAVTWSVVPNVGTISNGLYTAPTSVTSQQTVSVVATSSADTTQTASASVQLQPPAPTVSVSVNPPAAILSGGGSVQLSATVTGSSNTAVTWSISPSTLGTVNNGLYTAPASVSTQQTVTVTATSSADSTNTSSATVTLMPPAATATTVTLPLELIGPNGLTVSASVAIPQGANLSGQQQLWMQIHGLRYETQASVQINNSAWIPINTTNVTLLGNAAAYGGIGGGFSTLKMTMNLPAGTVTSGSNTIRFRFNQTDGRVSGFRVLNFNFLDANGNQLLPASTFVYDDPNTWQPPSTASSDIAAGKSLWFNANLTAPTPNGPVAIQAHCSDCHAQDGRDLKYFNYSNNSIEARSVFHGLTAQQGTQIASYIRSLNVPNPGRPWNPPYQPGPGLDEQPVSNWAAGAGIDAVLDNDQELLQAIFPNGIQDSVFSPTGNLNQREISIPFQLPDWNQWLPGTNPKDTFGTAKFTASTLYNLYQTIRAGLNVADAQSYMNQANNIWAIQYQTYLLRLQAPVPSSSDAASWTAGNADAVYSISQWSMVKTWEIMNEFQLEGYAQNVFGPQAAPRAWYSAQPFYVSPHILNIPQGVPGLRNGSKVTWNYLAFIWYQLQLTLNDSNRRQSGSSPIDWGYAFAFADNMADAVQPQAALHYLWLIKSLQISNNGQGPNVFSTGFDPAIPNLFNQVRYDQANIWAGVPASTRAALENGIAKAYIQVVTQFTPQQFYAGGWASASEVPKNTFSTTLGTNDLGSELWFAIPQFKYFGLEQSLVNQWTAWAQKVWPAVNWSSIAAATCGPGYMQTLQIQCSTEH